MIRPQSVEQVQEAVRSHRRLLPRGAATKPPLSATHNDDVVVIEVNSLSGVIEYEPGEFTFTALAGTPLSAIAATLAEHGQHLPFDPPLVDAGATIGGTIAAGLSGSNRLRSGGVRDFVIGVRIVDGVGALIRGGGKVVKNAAGFDLPKFMVGSLGRFGIITELTFKVFPRPASYLTLRTDCGDLNTTVETLGRLSREPWDFEAMDIEPPSTLVLRLSGDGAALRRRAERLAESAQFESQIAEDDAAYWRSQREFEWVGEHRLLIKLPLTPQRITEVDGLLEAAGAERRYAVAGNVAWVAWPAEHPVESLHQSLNSRNLSALVVRGAAERIRLGADPARPFIARVRAALDPEGRFVE